MPHREAIEGFLAVLPGGKVIIQQASEACVVAWFQDMDHLVDDEVLQALAGLTRQLAVEADGLPRGAAASPLGLHSLNEEPLHLHSDDWLPFCDQPGNSLLEAFAIPLLDDLSTTLKRCSLSMMQNHLLRLEFDSWRPLCFLKCQ